MTYSEAISYLSSLQMFGANFGLETTLRLAALAGNPHEQLRFIHVAGTNGKGSTCAMLESIYRASGLRVGLFTSPHLVSFRERIQVNRELISEADVARLVADLRRTGVAPVSIQNESDQSTKDGDRRDACPTFFEIVTVMALRYFEEQKCDLVIWETGLGGRLDATNIVTPLASVITSISLDHQQWLGDTLAKIAAEKAGILKPGVPAVTAVDEPEVLEVIGEVARRQGAALNVVTAAEVKSNFVNSMETGATPVLRLLGEHQWLNAALALAVVRVLQEKIPVSEAALSDGLAHVEWPGRMQIVERGAQTLLLDGAHNPASAAALRSALQLHFPRSKPALVLGILRDKDWRKVCEILAPLAETIFLVPVSSERTCAPEDLRAACAAANPRARVVVCGSLADVLEQAVGAPFQLITGSPYLEMDELRARLRFPFIVITGSLYLVGEAMELMKLSGASTGERSLNEWGAVRVRISN